MNCNLYTVEPLERTHPLLVAGVLNSSAVILAKHLYGRPAGVEGNLKTEIVDVDMMPVPDWTSASDDVAARVTTAMHSLYRREVIGLLSPRRLRRKSMTDRGRESELDALSDDSELDRADRRNLDSAVLELLGVSDAAERERLIDQLYNYLGDYFENVRVKEEEAIDNKRRAARQSTLGVDQIATDVLGEIERDHPLLMRSYTDHYQRTDGDGLRIPAGGEPSIVTDLVTCGVRFGEGRTSQIITTRGREQAELVEAIARVGPRGRALFVPSNSAVAQELTTRLHGLCASRERIVRELVEQRTSDADLIERSEKRVLAALIAGSSRPRRAAALAAA